MFAVRKKMFKVGEHVRKSISSARTVFGRRLAYSGLEKERYALSATNH